MLTFESFIRARRGGKSLLDIATGPEKAEAEEVLNRWERGELSTQEALDEFTRRFGLWARRD